MQKNLASHSQINVINLKVLQGLFNQRNDVFFALIRRRNWKENEGKHEKRGKIQYIEVGT